MAEILLRVFMVVVGLFVFSVTTVSLAKKHMTEVFCIFWGIIAVLFIAAGILLQPSGWNRYISWQALVIICFGIVCILIAGFFFSVRISRLMRQVTELAIQISLLNHENEMLLNDAEKLQEETEITYGEEQKDEKEDLIYN